MGPTLDADAHIFQVASSFWTQKGALDAVSTARRPCAEGWGKKWGDREKIKNDLTGNRAQVSTATTWDSNH